MIKYKVDSNIRYESVEELLVNSPKIVLVNKFNEEAAKKFRENMEEAVNTGQTTIPVVIDSYGGEVYSLLSMIDTINSVPSDIRVATVITGKAMSCGAVLFTFGAEGHRYMAPNATLMIHDVSSGAHGKIEEIKADAKEGDRLNDLIYTMMARNCGHSDQKYFWKIVQDKGRADWYLDVKEAIGHNLANHARVPKYTLTVKYEACFG
jgi:ATP-dependent Clp protease, protease subunit